MNRIYSAHGRDLADEMLGRSIVSLTKDSVTLDNGTVLTIEGGGDCCAWFEGAFREVSLSDNIITRVEDIYSDAHNYDADELFTIHIYSAHALMVAVDVNGYEGSGYYGSSFDLVVKRGDNG